ncbi:hypothetical protein [Novispirillum itersonii]|uniref:Cytoskeletal protein RodZ n=1 Tax=Novispirillum itersonii TaxID=189 RepID=A0A7W9ZK00_NOVIT|nr:hypothetical protein [Novispirillum itersonii]MBB6211932.1 cytoskeletal protein RodZ [Novispirillum itersonii]
MNVALRALAVGSVVVFAAAAAQAADLSTPAVQVAQAQPAATAADQQPAPAKKQEKAAETKAADPKAADAKAAPAKTDAKAAPAKTETKTDAKAEPKADAKPADAKTAAPAAAGAATPAAKPEEKPLPANIAGECAYTGKRIVSLLARDDVDQARKFMDFYRLFSCDEKHIGPTFRCLVNDSTVNASAEDINARIDRCWTKQD